MPHSAFREIFEPLRGRRIGYIRLQGNVGDTLIEAAAFQMMRHFQIDFVVTEPSSNLKVDEWLIAGGGNMGSYYEICQQERRQVLADGRPVSVLPQSFILRNSLPTSASLSGKRRVLTYHPTLTWSRI